MLAAYAVGMAYQHQTFPKWKYHATERARVVHSVEEEEALGDSWADRPDLVSTKPAAAENEDDTPAAESAADDGEKPPAKRGGGKNK